LPVFPDVVIAVAGDTRVLEKVPPWVTPFLTADESDDPTGRLLTDYPTDFARSLESVVDDVLEGGGKIDDYCVEFRAPGGSHHAVMLFADLLPPTVADGPAPRVMIRLHDVSHQVRQRKELVVQSSFQGMIGRSNAMRAVFRKIAIYGPSEAPVVVTGETGSGKELVAAALHRVSGRRGKEFVTVNCSAISDDLFESELFGHDRGAFTGAARTHRGRFERASGGTLFMDEIGDMPPLSQTKLLRALETGLIERVGGEKPIEVDVRVVAATNVALEEAVGMGRFRADLFHRLAVFRIHVPPLREHRDDIPLLVDHFLQVFGQKYQRPPLRLTPDALLLLQDYGWPGNVRELRNVIERVVVESPNVVIGRAAFAEWVHERFQLVRSTMNAQDGYGPQAGYGSQTGYGHGPQPGYGPVAALPASTAPATGSAFGPNDVVIDSDYQPAAATPRPKRQGPLTADDLRRAAAAAAGNLTRAAELLGVHKATLYRHMQRLGLTRDDLEANGENPPSGGR